MEFFLNGTNFKIKQNSNQNKLEISKSKRISNFEQNYEM
jgi:hypothetical protein